MGAGRFGHDKYGEAVGARRHCGDELVVHTVEPQNGTPVDCVVNPERLVRGSRLRRIIENPGAIAPLAK